MSVIDDAINALRSERDRLAGDIVRIDQAITALNATTEPAAKDPVATGPAVKPAARGERTPTRIVPGQDMVSCPDCGKKLKQQGLGPHRPSHARAKQLAAAPVDRPAPAAPVGVGAIHQSGHFVAIRPALGRCSCGKTIADADAWAAHNQAISNPAGHRLIRNEETA